LALADLLREGRVHRIIATLRADFLSRLDELGALREDALRSAVALGPLAPEALGRTIALPARTRGVAVEPELVEKLVGEAAGIGALPLLEFALEKLWDTRDRERAVLTSAGWRALGGLEGALAAHADAALARLSP